jgi:hypothetical protein
MATTDLCSALSRDIKIDENMEQRICAAVLKQLGGCSYPPSSHHPYIPTLLLPYTHLIIPACNPSRQNLPNLHLPTVSPNVLSSTTRCLLLTAYRLVRCLSYILYRASCIALHLCFSHPFIASIASFDCFLCIISQTTSPTMCSPWPSSASPSSPRRYLLRIVYSIVYVLCMYVLMNMYLCMCACIFMNCIMYCTLTLVCITPPNTHTHTHTHSSGAGAADLRRVPQAVQPHPGGQRRAARCVRHRYVLLYYYTTTTANYLYYYYTYIYLYYYTTTIILILYHTNYYTYIYLYYYTTNFYY